MGTPRQGQGDCNSGGSPGRTSPPYGSRECHLTEHKVYGAPQSYATRRDMRGLGTRGTVMHLDPELGAQDKLQAHSLLWPAGVRPAVAGKDASPPLLVGTGGLSSAP